MTNHLNDCPPDLTTAIFEYADNAALDIIAEYIAYDPALLDDMTTIDAINDFLDPAADRLESFSFSSLPIDPNLLHPIIDSFLMTYLLNPTSARHHLLARALCNLT